MVSPCSLVQPSSQTVAGSVEVDDLSKQLMFQQHFLIEYIVVEILMLEELKLNV